MTGVNRDILITRVLDGEATPEDWAAFRAMAARDQAVWADLADAQQDRADLAAAIADAIAVADRVEAPVHHHAGERLNARIRTGVAWLGWAAAAMVAVVGFTGRFGAVSSPGTEADTQQAGLFSISSPEDAMRLYLDKGLEAGSVLGELPDRVMLSSTPAADGNGYTVVYLRQIVERHHVDSLFQLGEDEIGQPVVVPMVPKRAKNVTY
ncbi:MAG: hypothetical protein Q9O74_08165 [Planctomycetota bacterium]|nr:hypothetical protein [Planctomycetota bacterium]